MFINSIILKNIIIYNFIKKTYQRATAGGAIGSEIEQAEKWVKVRDQNWSRQRIHNPHTIFWNGNLTVPIIKWPGVHTTYSILT